MSTQQKQKMSILARRGLLLGVLLFICVSTAISLLPLPASAAPASQGGDGGSDTVPTTPIVVPEPTTKYVCGSGKNAVKVSINFGCYGNSATCANKDGCSAVMDAAFAILRFLTAGVGIVLIASTAWAGVQLSSARDDPGAVSKAKDRFRNNLFALLMFIFAYAILAFVIPAGFFK